MTSEPGKPAAGGDLRARLQIKQPSRRRIGTPATVMALAVILGVGGLAFAVGRMTAPAVASTFNGFGGTGRFGNGNGNGTGGLPGGGFRGGGLGGFNVVGTVTAVNGDTITVQTANGTSIHVQTSNSTAYEKSSTGSASDVQNGSRVIVEIQAGAGGFGAFGGGGGGTGNGTQTITLPASTIIVGGQ